MVKPGLKDAYINSLKDLPSSRLERNSPITGNQLAMGFLNSFINDVEELLLSCKLKASGEDQLRSLREELKFLIVFLMDPVKQDEKKKISDYIFQSIEAVARHTAPVIHLLLVSIKDTSEVDLYPLFHLLDKINRIKEELKKSDFSLSNAMESNFPQLNALELIDLVSGTLSDVLNYKNHSIAFVRHQLGIVKAKLVCLKSLLSLSDPNVEGKATIVVHKAKHAIGSLIIREVPLWPCMLQLSEVIKRIQIVNTKLAAIFVDERFEIGVDAGAQNSDSSSLVALPPEKDEMEVGIDNDTETAVELREKVTKGSTRLCLISVFVVPNSKGTLVEEVYNEIAHLFPVHAWIFVQQKYEKRDLLMELLLNIAKDVQGEVDNLNVTELENKLNNHLQSAKYLIVLNDKWGNGAWNDISRCFPNNNFGSRVLLLGLPE